MRVLASAAADLSAQILEIIYPQNPIPELGEGIAEKQGLRNRCLAVIAPKAAREALSFLTRDGGVQSLTEPGRFFGIKYCLFRPESALWKPNFRTDLIEIIRQGRTDFVIYENVRTYFNLLVDGLQHGLESVSKRDVAVLLSDSEFVQCLWETVISRGIQYRMQIVYIRARQALIQNGIPEIILTLTDDLKSRITEEESRSSAQTPGHPTGTHDGEAGPD